MKTKLTLSASLPLLALVLAVSLPLPGLAQATNDPALAKQQMQLEKQKLELEKRSLELQRREQELEKARLDLKAQESAQSLRLNLAGDLLFDYDKAALKPAAEEALNKVAVVLSLFPESKVRVEGYTDAKGGKSVNMTLSKERAATVKNWLVKNGGIAPAIISSEGFGEENPVAPNTTADGKDDPVGRARNRRVSIVVDKPPGL
jgi:outer membrane protein OmpA-like peptidoglycan-associated protein